MSTVDLSCNISHPDQFEVSVPLNGQNSSNITTVVLTGPRTIISRFSDAAASTGNILPIIPLYLNSTYMLKFHGPKIECEDASPLVAGIIENLIDSQMATSESTEIVRLRSRGVISLMFQNCISIIRTFIVCRDQ
jgi:hypothetical protein